MGRSKTKLELIQDHKTRKTTFLKRKASLIKKISELSILCDIKACIIIYESYQENHQQEIWPHDPNQVQELIHLYKKQPLDNRRKRTGNLSSFFENQKRKVEREVAKLKKKKIKTRKYPTWDSRFNCLSQKELRNFASALEKKIENMKQKLEFLKSSIIQDSNGCSVTQDEIWDYLELVNPMPCPINSYGNNVPFIDNKFFQDFMTSEYQVIPSGGVNSMDINGQLTVGDYQFGNAYTRKFESENWLMKNDIGARECYFGSGSMTMQQQQPMNFFELEYPFVYCGSTTQMPCNGF